MRVCVYLYIFVYSHFCIALRSFFSHGRALSENKQPLPVSLSLPLSPSLSLRLSLCSSAQEVTVGQSDRDGFALINCGASLPAPSAAVSNSQLTQLTVSPSLTFSLPLSLAPVPKIRAHFARGIWTRTQTRIRNRTRCGNEIPQAERKWQHENII